MKSAVVAILSIVSTPLINHFLSAQSTGVSDSGPRVLTAAERIGFGVPMFSPVGNAVCDSAGNMFFNVGSLINRGGPFLRFSHDGKAHKVFSLPEATTPGTISLWTVTPDGRLFTLLTDPTGSKLIEFKENGATNTSALDIPPGIVPTALAVSDTETAFIEGYREKNEPGEIMRKGFAGLFDNSGQRTRELDAADVDVSKIADHPLEGDAVAGDDGRFYELKSSEIRVIEQNGETDRVLKFEKPESNASPQRIDYSRGFVSIVFYSLKQEPNPKRELEISTVILNVQNGELRGSYAFAPENFGDVVCFNLSEGYSLLAKDGKMAARDVVPIR